MQKTSSKNKIWLFAAICVILSIWNVTVYFAHFTDHLRLTDYTAEEQLLYNPSFEEEGYAADSLIRELARGREVIVPRGLRPYNEYPSYGHMHDEGNPFSREYFWENNYTKYFTEYASSVTVDESLPDLYELNRRPIPKAVLEEFTLLGPGNDMMRYAHMADHTEEEVSNQFYYTYVYTVDTYYPYNFSSPSDLGIYIRADGLSEEESLVAIWDTGENLYLMGKSYYDSALAGRYGT